MKPHIAPFPLPWRTLAAWVLALLVTGCGVSSQLHLSDPSTTNLSLRAVYRVGGGPGGSGIEAEASSVRAQGEQYLNASQVATLNKVTIKPVAKFHAAL